MAIRAEQALRTPETFPAAQLLAKDFDGTVAQTFEKSPSGVGVHEAHELTVETMFGVKALDHYIDGGGLRNRAPVEVVQDLAPDAKGDELNQLVSRFIDTKLSVLMGEIGTRFSDGNIWPRPTTGYLGLRERIEEARDDGLLIDDLILSSGHEPFIRKTYQAWNVGEPTHIVAEEAIRQLALDLPIEQLVKPSPVLMDVAHNVWRQGYGLKSTSEPVLDERDRIVYVGDDPIKDGELAKSSGVDFVLLDPGNSFEIWQSVASRLHLGHAALRGAEQDA